MQGARFGQDLAYWAERLRGMEPLALPTDRPRPRFPSYRSAKASLALPATLRAALQELAGAQDVTMLMLVTAAFTAVLARYAGQEEIVIGTVASGRGAPRLRTVMGPLINMVVLRNDLSGDPSFTELLTRTRATTRQCPTRAAAHRGVDDRWPRGRRRARGRSSWHG
jgi:Condensation domain